MIKSALRIFASGFLMGSADVVPGVSGGTIALVVGVYERLVTSIREGSSALGALLRWDISEFRRHLASVEWPFLITLLAGILTAVLSLAHFISVQLEERPVLLAAAFFGLVLGSAIVAFREIRNPRPMHLAMIFGTGVALFLLLGVGSGASFTDPSLPVFFGSGALAICAMILPGISGSLLLVLMGMYDAVLGAVDGRDIAAVGVFALGAIVGLALFSQILYRALKAAHDAVLAVLIGLMAGSLRILWPWPDGVASSLLESPGSDIWSALAAAAIGLVAVLAIARLGRGRADLSESAVSDESARA